MKIISVGLLFLVLSYHVFSEDYLSGEVYNSPADDMAWSFFNGSLNTVDFDGNETKYKYKIESGKPYDFLYVNNGKSEDKYLMLMSDYFLPLYKEGTNKPIYEAFFGINLNLFTMHEPKYSASSTLVEGSRKYPPEDLKLVELGRPWVEGVEGDGIGEKITITAKHPIDELVISNGFCSWNSAHYFNNNRVKRLRISNSLKPTESFEVNIPDSPKPFNILVLFTATDLVIEILEVYKGDKYSDTCINFLLSISNYW